MIPIVGARKAAQLTDNLGALDVRLSDEQIARLNNISAYPLPFPQSFVDHPRMDSIMYGGTRDLIDTHRPRVTP